MLIEAHGRFQITIPSEIVKKLDIKEGEQLEVVEKTADFFYVLSISFLCPVVTYPKAETMRIAKLIKEADGDYKNGKAKTY